MAWARCISAIRRERKGSLGGEIVEKLPFTPSSRTLLGHSDSAECAISRRYEPAGQQAKSRFALGSDRRWIAPTQ
jgi:hypothetical protein